MTYRGPAVDKIFEDYVRQQAGRITRCVQLHPLALIVAQEALTLDWPVNLYYDDQLEVTIQHPDAANWTKDDHMPEIVVRFIARLEKKIHQAGWKYTLLETIHHPNHTRAITYNLSHEFLRITDGTLRIKVW